MVSTPATFKILVKLRPRELRELRPPLVHDLAVHVHQQGNGRVARGEEVQPRCDSLRVVMGNARRRTRLLGSSQVSDGTQLLDQICLDRLGRCSFTRCRGGGYRRIFRLVAGATRERAHDRAKERGEKKPDGARSHGRRIASRPSAHSRGRAASPAAPDPFPGAPWGGSAGSRERIPSAHRRDRDRQR